MNKATDYHSTLLLNNIGVLLLEQGSYKQAARTLRDSLEAMRKIFNGRSLASPALDLSRSANQARKHIQSSDSSNETSIALFLADKGIVAGKHDCTSFEYLLPVTIQIPESAVGFTTIGRDPQLEMSVIFNNIGIALYLLCSDESTSPSASSVSTDSRESALRMMSLASSVVSSRFALCLCDDMDEESRIMSVALIVTGNTIHLCQAAGQASDAKLYTDKYQRMILTSGAAASL
jgi:hypothetical protein